MITHVIDSLYIGTSKDGVKALAGDGNFDAVINLMRNKSPHCNSLRD